MSDIDTNINNWSINDIYELFQVNNTTVPEINKAADRLINSSFMSGNNTITEFLKQAKEKAIEFNLQSQDETDFKEQAGEQLMSWKNSQFLKQNDKSQSVKTTNRDNVVKTFDDGTHFQMKQEKLGINQSYNVPVAQDTINPKQVNIIERTIVIDSQYRQHVLPYSGNDISSPAFNTNFSIDVSDSLSNVLSIQLNSIQIPQTWYNISSYLGNNTFLFINNETEFLCAIPDGYYNIPIEWSINPLKVNVCGDLFVEFIYSTTTMKISVSVNSSSITSPYPCKIIWHTDKIMTNYSTQCNYLNTSAVNNNLGWYLGFKTISPISLDLETTFSDINVKVFADSTCSLYGSNYFMLCIDDYQHNRVNKEIIGTVDTTSNLELPSYDDSKNRTKDLYGNCVAFPTFPRKLTQAQIYTINTIYQNRNKKKSKITAPIINNVLSLIPIPIRQTITMLNLSGASTSYSLPTPLVLSGTSLNSNTREYFGPVSIDRLGIKLIDDKGNLVNLNGADWSFTIKIKQLYQY